MKTIDYKQSSRSESFLDGCHRYGWLIAPTISLVGTLMMLAHFSGVMEEQVKSLHEQATLLRTEMKDGFDAVSTRIYRDENMIDGLKGRGR